MRLALLFLPEITITYPISPLSVLAFSPFFLTIILSLFGKKLAKIFGAKPYDV
jgi:hypothetical protein